MSLVREAALVAGKDLRIEARAKVISQQIVPFGLIVLLPWRSPPPKPPSRSAS